MMRRTRLTEKAMTTQDAAGRQLGLAIVSRRDKMYVVYDVAKFAVAAAIHYSKFKKLTAKDVARRNAAVTDMQESMVAFMACKQTSGKQWEAAEVKASAAEQGWGPMLYDIVMAMEGGLVPDRGTVKPGARKVWRHYYDKRKDVRAMPLDDENEPATEETGDDTKNLYGDRYDSEDPLDYAYFSDNFPNTSALSNNHFAGIKASGLSEGEYEDLLIDNADEYFDRRYHNG